VPLTKISGLKWEEDNKKAMMILCIAIYQDLKLSVKYHILQQQWFFSG
jgi:hypothetical protein